MQFANPIFLWALTGLSVPIGIHLLSRKEGKVIKLGSLRHVHETSTQQFRGIRLNEILLLILRCLLIIIFTLIISGLSWNGFQKSKWVLIEKGLVNQPQLASVFDSLSEEGYQLRLLAETFPLLKDSSEASAYTNYQGLLEKLESENLSQAIVFAQSTPGNFRGLRSTLPANVRWISQSQRPFDYTLREIQISTDTVETRRGHTSAEATYFTSDRAKLLSNDIKSPDTVSVSIVSESNYAYDLKIIKAALMSIGKSFPVKLKISEKKSTDETPNDSDWCIWLSNESIPHTDSAKILYVKPTDDSELLMPSKRNEWIITKRLNDDAALNQNLTLKLASLLIPTKELQRVADSKDRRMLPDSIAWSVNVANNENIVHSSIPQPANPYLILLLLALLFVERMIAYQRNQ